MFWHDTESYTHATMINVYSRKMILVLSSQGWPFEYNQKTPAVF